MVQFQSGSVSLGMVLIRVVLGLLLTLQGWSSITAEGGIPNVLAGADFSSPFFAWWGQNLVAEHPEVVSKLIVWLEFLCGVALTLGALVRPLGTWVAFMMLCFALSGPRPLERELVILAGTCALGCALSGAGKLLGLDALFDQHFPRWVTWKRG